MLLCSSRLGNALILLAVLSRSLSAQGRLMSGDTENDFESRNLNQKHYIRELLSCDNSLKRTCRNECFNKKCAVGGDRFDDCHRKCRKECCGDSEGEDERERLRRLGGHTAGDSASGDSFLFESGGLYSSSREGGASDDEGGMYETVSLHPDYLGEQYGGLWKEFGYAPPYVWYLDSPERQLQKLSVSEDDGLLYQDGMLFDTSDATTGGVSQEEGRAIFVMAPDGTLYASKWNQVGHFHHSSLLAGSDVAAAGELGAVNGTLVLVTSCSGHYRPPDEITMQALDSLENMGYDDIDSVDYESCARRRKIERSGLSKNPFVWYPLANHP